MISSHSVINLSTTIQSAAVWSSSLSQPIRIFHHKPIDFSVFQANMSVLFQSGRTFPDTFVWSIGQPAQAIVANFLRYSFFLTAVLFLWKLIRSGEAFNDLLTQQLTVLLCGVMIASDPFYIIIFFTAGSEFHVFDSLLHLFFVVMGILLLPFLIVRRSGFQLGKQAALNLFPFLVTFCVLGMLTVREVLDLDDDPANGANSALQIARMIVFSVDLVVMGMLGYLYRGEDGSEKLFVITLAVVFPIAEVISEIGQFFNPQLIGNVQIFELIVAVEHVAFFATNTWPGKNNRDMGDEESVPESNKNIGENEAILFEPRVRI
jgi:hypothetical protein